MYNHDSNVLTFPIRVPLSQLDGNAFREQAIAYRLERIKQSIDRINKLMTELRGHAGICETPEPRQIMEGDKDANI